MRKLLSIPALMVLLMLSGCSISKIDTASNSGDEDQNVNSKRAYTINEKDNISRVSFVSGSGEETDIQIKFDRSTNANAPKDIRLDGSSGSVENTPTFRGFRDVKFPFEGTLYYTIKPRLSRNQVQSTKSGNSSSNSSSDLQCRLSFTINSSGSWVIKVAN